MTANAMPGDRQKCLNAQMNDYVSKPVSPQSLAAVLQRWLPAASAPVPPQRADTAPAELAILGCDGLSRELCPGFIQG